CATLDDVRARHPELSTRRFLLGTATPRAVETPIRLTALLSDGKHCFRANAIVEKVHQAGESPGRSEPGMTLWLARMDDPGRELVAWMGGQPPPLLKQPAAAEGAGPAAAPAKKAVGPPAGKPASAEQSARPAPRRRRCRGPPSHPALQRSRRRWSATSPTNCRKPALPSPPARRSGSTSERRTPALPGCRTANRSSSLRARATTPFRRWSRSAARPS